MTAVANAIELRDFGLGHRRPDGEEMLFVGADLALAEHGFYLLSGSSGGGKSSLLRVLAGLNESREVDTVLRGELMVHGHSLRGDYPAELRGSTAAILQDEGLLDELSPRANVELALRATERSVRLAPALLAQAGIDDPPPSTSMLSGGMRKRVAVARALAASPRLLLCDEPTAGLDAEAGRDIAQALREAHDSDKGRTTIVVTHDQPAFEGLIDGILVLDRAAQRLTLETPEYHAGVTPRAVEAARDPTVGSTFFDGVARLLLRLGVIGETVLEALRRLPPVELRLTLSTTLRFILEPIAFVAACGAVIGGLATFFALRNNPVAGAFESALLNGTGKVSTAVLVPLLSGLFFAARTAAGATARLGTMKRTNQVAALSMMGIRPADYLLTPLVWGMTLAMPVVTAAGIVGASLAAAFAAWMVGGFLPASWAVSWFGSVTASDLLLVLGKSCLSGFAMALCCYYLGTGPKRSGRDVGEAVNSAIVAGTALVLAVHAVLTFWAYA